jgi:RNA polymerase sigma factor (sigma-70 family)
MLNLASDAQRRSFRRPERLVAEPEAGSHDPFGAADDRQLLLDAVRQLPPRQRMIVVLRYWGDLSEAEIAAELSISPGTVKSQAHHAMTHLRAYAAERRSNEGRRW